MHRHGYKGKKLSRQKDARRLLVKNLASDLIVNRKLKTTWPKAKVVLPYVERLITKAKKGGLHNRRQVIAKLATAGAAHRLVDDLAPRLSSRGSGHLRLTKLKARSGDNALLAEINFVDDLAEPEARPAAEKPPAAKPDKTAADQPDTPTEEDDAEA